VRQSHSARWKRLYLQARANAIDIWFLPLHNAIVTAKLTLDKAGRVVLPKPLRDRLQLAPGDTLHLESEGERITLRPVRQNVMLKKELGVWVYQGEPADDSILDLIDRDRENRNRSVTESDAE
jgi:AbrB family looped-hinge helix DNA binding protein